MLRCTRCCGTLDYFPFLYDTLIFINSEYLVQLRGDTSPQARYLDHLLRSPVILGRVSNIRYDYLWLHTVTVIRQGKVHENVSSLSPPFCYSFNDETVNIHHSHMKTIPHAISCFCPCIGYTKYNILISQRLVREVLHDIKNSFRWNICWFNQRILCHFVNLNLILKFQGKLYGTH